MSVRRFLPPVGDNLTPASETVLEEGIGVGWLSEAERRTVTAALARLIPAGEDPVTEPGAAEASVVDYVDRTLDAFSHDPPLVFAGGPSSGRRGGTAAYTSFLPLSRIEEIPWRQRVEAWQATYRAGLDALGAGFPDLSGDEQDARLDELPDFKALLYEHACEGFYGAPEYGGNRDLAGWRLADHAGDVAPIGWTPEQVTSPVENP